MQGNSKLTFVAVKHDVKMGILSPALSKADNRTARMTSMREVGGYNMGRLDS